MPSFRTREHLQSRAYCYGPIQLNRPLSRNTETKHFARPNSDPVRGWAKAKLFDPLGLKMAAK